MYKNRTSYQNILSTYLQGIQILIRTYAVEKITSQKYFLLRERQNGCFIMSLIHR